MGAVVDLEKQRMEQLANELVPLLRERQHVVRNLADVDDVERWRRAGRRAGRLLGVRVRTGVSDRGQVWVAQEVDRRTDG